MLRDTLVESCRGVHLSMKVEACSGLSQYHDHTHPADILVQKLGVGKPATFFDLIVTSPLNSNVIAEVDVWLPQSAPQAAKLRNHMVSDKD